MPASAQVIALVLAAGRGRRFGGDKRRAALADGRPLLVATLDLARRCFAEVFVVLREEDDALALGIPPGVGLIRCAEADRGMGHSLAAGVTALAGHSAQALALLLGDMPWITPASLRALAAHAAGERIVYGRYRGRRGHPVLFGRRFWGELRLLQGDTGARALIDRHTDACLALDLDDPGLLADIDTPPQLQGRTL